MSSMDLGRAAAMLGRRGGLAGGLIVYQVLAYGAPDQRTWLVERVGHHAVRAWLRKRRGGGLPTDRLSEWFDARTIRRWHQSNPGAAIWKNR
jgi:hypothetical protein